MLTSSLIFNSHTLWLVSVYPLTVQPVGRGETSLYYIAYLDAMSKFDSIERERLF